MKWLHDNIVGMALLAVATVLLLVSLAIAVVWAWPVSGVVAGQAVQDDDAAGNVVVVAEIGPASDYQVINDRPVFSESRTPVVVENSESGSEVVEVITAREAPEVKLTGIFISPDVRIASLMPLQGEQISVTAKEGEPLIGDYVGWEVSTVQPRHVVLTSTEGDSLKLELKVHDVKIEEPPKPEVPVSVDAALAGAEEAEIPTGEDGEPLSRAEQIRARIAERREELRRQQAGETDEQSENGGEAQKAAPPPDYQSAIRNMINNRSKDNNSNDKKDS